ncbi:Gti1/Pac2 family-domain-containing protein [Gilbertella persicaria]|uniref:Gti1/Pac2 family-domain-containing protein n=1 Tax=Gilbertella persicaria TaxID=101096 RepID=UPI00221F0FB6|nr:Gti1/Pac2 family-domain-containing protein [Gilbertella persicaria]KAI8066954.1 Gti1/Pac2 family-domain-containing protein [Gilbertella persicaria]
MLVTETFHGYIETTQDVLLIFEGCRRGLLPRICRRLQERERKMIRSGSIFVFDERESGIKRWTDGRVWSPSRILGNFLIYRELDKKATGEKRMSNNSNIMSSPARRSFSLDNTIIDRNKERQLIGSLSDSYRFKEDGLIKKTMSVIVNGVAQHLISYYDPNEVLQEKLRSPSSVPELASLEISPELLVKQNFRIPPLVEPTFDQHDHLPHPHHQQQYHHQQNQGPLTPPDPTASSSYSRVMHPLRSMSVGSIRGHEQMIMRNEGIIYHPYQQQQQQQQRIAPQSPSISNHFQHSPSSNNNSNSNNNNIPTNIYHHDHHPQHSNSSMFPSSTSTMPSPSSLTSSPSTPMLSPARYQQQQQQQHQRHYSASSISSTSLPRFDSRNYAATDSFFDRSSSNSISQVISGPSVDNYQSPQPSNERFASPNLGQLLNPIHPLNNNNSISTHMNTATSNATTVDTTNDHTTTSSSSPSTPPPTSDAFLHAHQQHPYDYNTVVNPAPTTSSLRNYSSPHHPENNENTQPIPHPHHRQHSMSDMGNEHQGDGVNEYYMNYYQRTSLPNTQIHNSFMFQQQQQQQQQRQQQHHHPFSTGQ